MLRATPESPRMFKSDVLDFFSRTHPAVVPILFVPATVALIWFGVTARGLSLVESGLWFVVGAIVWSLTEYWLHRTLFHWKPDIPGGERMHFLLHGVHHTWPRDKYRLVMPPAVSITLFFVFGGMFYLLLPNTWVWPFHAGFTFGYMAYDLIHYYVHHFTPRTQYGKRLRKHHMIHHFKDDKNRFGVSSVFWDLVFGTRGT